MCHAPTCYTLHSSNVLRGDTARMCYDDGKAGSGAGETHEARETCYPTRSVCHAQCRSEGSTPPRIHARRCRRRTHALTHWHTGPARTHATCPRGAVAKRSTTRGRGGIGARCRRACCACSQRPRPCHFRHWRRGAVPADRRRCGTGAGGRAAARLPHAAAALAHAERNKRGQGVAQDREPPALGGL